MFFLVISEGPSPSAARPILALNDQRLVGSVLRQVTQRLTAHAESKSTAKRTAQASASPQR